MVQNPFNGIESLQRLPVVWLEVEDQENPFNGIESQAIREAVGLPLVRIHSMELKGYPTLPLGDLNPILNPLNGIERAFLTVSSSRDRHGMLNPFNGIER
jgi:hypothetical protein